VPIEWAGIGVVERQTVEFVDDWASLLMVCKSGLKAGLREEGSAGELGGIDAVVLGLVITTLWGVEIVMVEISLPLVLSLRLGRAGKSIKLLVSNEFTSVSILSSLIGLGWHLHGVIVDSGESWVGVGRAGGLLSLQESTPMLSRSSCCSLISKSGNTSSSSSVRASKWLVELRLRLGEDWLLYRFVPVDWKLVILLCLGREGEVRLWHLPGGAIVEWRVVRQTETWVDA
jgi:hypothetical protein